MSAGASRPRGARRPSRSGSEPQLVGPDSLLAGVARAAGGQGCAGADAGGGALLREVAESVKALAAAVGEAAAEAAGEAAGASAAGLRPTSATARLSPRWAKQQGQDYVPLRARGMARGIYMHLAMLSVRLRPSSQLAGQGCIVHCLEKHQVLVCR